MGWRSILNSLVNKYDISDEDCAELEDAIESEIESTYDSEDEYTEIMEVYICNRR